MKLFKWFDFRSPLGKRLDEIDHIKGPDEISNVTFGKVKYVVYDVILSTGKPKDGFWIFVNPANQKIVRVDYYHSQLDHCDETQLDPYQIEKAYWFFDYAING